MHLVTKCEFPPEFCAVTGHREDPNGFIDTGNTLPFIEPRIYVSHAGVMQLAEQYDMVTSEEHQVALDAIAQLSAEKEELESQLDDAHKTIEAFDTLASKGLVAVA